MSTIPLEYGIQSIYSVWLLSWVKALVAFVTISVPKFIYAVLSYSMTLTVMLNPLQALTCRF